MNPYQRRLANFTPFMVAQGVPGMGAGNMGGMQELHQGGGQIPNNGGFRQMEGMQLPEGAYLDRVQMTPEKMEQLKREGQQQSIQNPQYGVTNGLTEPNGMSILGGTLAPTQPQGTYTTPLRVEAGYSNIYGTNVTGSYDQSTGKIGVEAGFPIGPAENGFRVTGNASTTLPQGDRPAGYSFGFGFEKRNPIDPSFYENPGARKYKGGIQTTVTPMFQPQYQYQQPPMPY